MYIRTYSSLGSPELNLEETLALAARHDLPGVELRALAGTIDLPAHFAATYGTPRALAERLQSHPVRILSLDTSLKLAGGTAAEREGFLKFLPWAEELGVPRLRVFDGGSKSDPDALRAMADTVAWWRALRAQHGWRADIMAETHDALYSGEAINRFLAIAPGTGILWDTHNTWRVSGEDPLTTWRAIRPHVVHMHVKDSVSIPNGKHAYSYRLPGEGEFPMAALRAVIRDEFDGPVSLEWERLWHPELAPIDDAVNAATRSGWW
ncbi:MAG TPA: sugar phosphate isomerase/epimerase [Opitutaceae bacterium]